MGAPLSAIVAAQKQEQTRTKLQTAADTAVQEIGNVYYSVGYCTESIAEKCREFGMAALLSEMTPEVAKAFSSAMGLLAQAWPAFSDVPFPAMPERPVVPE